MQIVRKDNLNREYKPEKSIISHIPLETAQYICDKLNDDHQYAEYSYTIANDEYKVKDMDWVTENIYGLSAEEVKNESYINKIEEERLNAEMQMSKCNNNGQDYVANLYRGKMEAYQSVIQLLKGDEE